MAVQTAPALDWQRACAEVREALLQRRLGLDWRPSTLDGRPCFEAVLPLLPDWPTLQVTYAQVWACLFTTTTGDGRRLENAITLAGRPDDALSVLLRVEQRVAQDLPA